MVVLVSVCFLAFNLMRIQINQPKLFFVSFCCLFFFANASQAQTTTYGAPKQKRPIAQKKALIEKRAVYLMGSSSLNFGQQSLSDGSKQTSLNLNASGFYALNKYIAVGGFAAVDFTRRSVVNNANFWQFDFGPQIGFFLPNKPPIKPYMSGSIGPARIINKAADQGNEDGYYLRSELGLIYELSPVVGLVLACNYRKSFFDSYSNTSELGLNFGIILSL